MKRLFSLLLCLVLLLGVLPLGSRAAESPFVDVNESDWFYDAVLWAYENGVTKGVDETHFGPDSTVTRGQAVTFLHRAMGEPEPLSEENPFVDVKPSDYFYKAVLWAVELGITNGTDATHFSPKATCTTMHIITFLYRALGMGANGWGQAGADWAAAEGLLRDTGLDVTNKMNCPRAAVVTTLDRTVGDAANLHQLPEGVEALPDELPAEKSTTVTADDSALLTVDIVDVTAGVATPVSFELTSSLYLDSFSLLLNGAAVGTLTDEDGDGVYTGSFTVDRSVNAVLRFKARASVGGSTLESNEVCVTVRKPISAETEQTIDEVLPTVEGLMQTAADGLPADATEEQKAKARADAIYSYLESQTGYWEEGNPDYGNAAGGRKWVPGKVDEVHRDGDCITYQIGGVHFGAVCLDRADSGVDGFGADAQAAHENLLQLSSGDSWFTTVGEKAILLSHYAKNQTNESQLLSAIACEDTLKEIGYATTARYNFTWQDYLDLEEYSVIIVRSHGINMGGTSGPCICTREEATAANRKTYSAELQNGRIIAVSEIENKTSITRYYITPAFFTHYYKDAGKDLTARWFHLSLCEGLEREDMANALLDSGVDCVTGYTHTVRTEYNSNMTASMLTTLRNGGTIDEAIENAKDTYGEHDDHKVNPAVLESRGNESITLHETLSNGNFEAKTSFFGLWKWSTPQRYWRWAGNGKPVNRLAGYAVYNNYAAYISTGEGAYANETESLICQPILIPEDATTISFNYRVFSEEPAKPVGTPRNDHFYAALVDVNGKSQQMLLDFGVLSFRDLFSKKGDLLNAGQPCYVMDSWYRKTANVSAWRGKVVNLCFWVRDFSGNAYDTAVLIDKITIQ